MRLKPLLLVAVLGTAACAEGRPTATVVAGNEPVAMADTALSLEEMEGAEPEIDWEAVGRQIEALRANPPRLTGSRMVEGYRTGRCLLEVDGVTRISGPCYYRMEGNGAFHIDGPRQVFEGVDYPEGGNGPWGVSTDWWANVFLEDGKWTGYGNEEVEYNSGQGSRWGELDRQGACFSNETLRRDDDVGDFHPDYQQKVRVCLWAG